MTRCNSLQLAPAAPGAWQSAPLAETAPKAQLCATRGGKASSCTAYGHQAEANGSCALQKQDRFDIKADVPGVDKQAIKLNVAGDVLTLSVQKSETKQVRAECVSASETSS